jgi:phage terminase small subunit
VNKLTAKQEMFVKEYLIDLNATQAAIRAGYSEDTARQIASDNLSKVYIQEAIQEAKDKRSKSTEITAESISVK